MSSATVSLVLNGKAAQHGIRPEVAQRVEAYAREVGYRRNHLAKSLRTGKTKLIGMIVESIGNPFFASIARLVEEKVYALGYRMIYGSTENDPEKARVLIDVFREHQVDGYIVAPTLGLEAELENLVSEKRPVVVFDRAVEIAGASVVLTDNYTGALDGMQHLVKNGYHRIGLVTLDSVQPQMNARVQGYRDTVARQGSEPVELAVPYSAVLAENLRLVRNFLKANPQLDALFFTTNYLLLAGVEALKLFAGLGEDRPAILAFDDDDHFAFFSPSITAVAQPVDKIACSIVRELMERLEARPQILPERTVVLPVTLCVRESSRKRSVQPSVLS